MKIYRQNELFQKSTSPYKDFQNEQFTGAGKLLNGRQSKTDIIDGEAFLVIFNFKEGLIHSENDEPAIEYPNHWEFWKDGLIEKVVDDGGRTVEYWENGVPVKIEHRDE